MWTSFEVDAGRFNSREGLTSTCVALTVVGFNVNVGVYMAISMAFVDSGGLCSRSMWVASTVVGFDTSTCMALTVVGFKVSAGVYVAFVGGVGHQCLSGD